MNFKKTAPAMFAILIAIVGLIVISSPVFAYVAFTNTYLIVPSTIEPGSKASIIFTLNNVGTDFSGETVLKFISTQYISTDMSSFDLQTVKAGGSAQVVVPITVDSDAPEGTLAIPFTVSYTIGNAAGSTTLDGSVAITITRRAILQISDVQFDKSVIQAGDTVDMTLSIHSNGQGEVKNLVVSLPSSSVPIAPTMTDSEKYVGTVLPGQDTSVTFGLVVNTNAEATVYNLPVLFSYYNEQGSLKNDTKYIGLRVTGIPSFIVALESSSNLYLGANGQVSITVANTGTGVANFVTATVHSDLSASPTTNYLGSMNPDDTNTLVLDVIPMSLGEHDVNITLDYRDSYNQQFSKSYPVSFEVTSMPFSFPLTYVIIIAVAAVILIYWKRDAIFRRRR